MNFDTSFDRGSQPRRRDYRLVIVALAVLAAIVGWLSASFYAHRPLGSGAYHVSANDLYRYAGDLRGPLTATTMTPPTPTPWRIYDSGTASRLAIYLTDPKAEWLGLAHGLKAIGVPFTITTDLHAALLHRLVLAYPALNGTNARQAQRAIEAFVRDGGTFVAFNVLDPDLQAAFGISAAQPSSTRSSFAFEPAYARAYGFDAPQERSVRFADSHDPSLNMGSYGYRVSSANVIARFDDGSAALVERQLGNGTAYAIGLDLGTYFLKGYNNRQERIATNYVNAYQPGLDVFLRLIKTLYRQVQPDAVTIGTVPGGKRFSAIIAHDVDSAVAIGLCLPYARDEHQLGVATTYFIQTKYVRDYNDAPFFTDSAGDMSKQLAQMGMEVASHSVSHSREFAHFPQGDGTASYPAYLPFILDPHRTYNGSIMGELRVSKFILEHFTGSPVVSFRPGNLSNPFSLPEHLAQTGYRFTSATTANDSLTHLPFQLDAGRDISAEVPVFEIPITIEDEESPRMDRREDAAARVTDAIARYGGVVSILIHPSVTSYKLAFENWFIRRYQQTAYFGTYRDFGTWWAARNAVTIDAHPSANGLTLSLTAPEAIRDLPLELPPGYRASGPLVRSMRGSVAVLAPFHGSITLQLTRS